MSDHHFLVVTFDTRQSLGDEQLTAILNRAQDWVQFAPNCWLLWTRNGPKVWYRRFKGIMRKGDNVLIFEANMSHRAGNMPSSFWQFVKSKFPA